MRAELHHTHPALSARSSGVSSGSKNGAVKVRNKEEVEVEAGREEKGKKPEW